MIVNVMSMMKVVVALVPSIAREGENGGQEESQRVKTSIQMGQIQTPDDFSSSGSFMMRPNWGRAGRTRRSSNRGGSE